MPAPIRASAFLDSIGVAVHLPHLNNATKSTQALEALTYLGVDHVRAVATPNLLTSGSVYGKLAGAGIEFTMLLPSYKDPVATVGSIAAFERAFPGAVQAIEAPNEINNWPVTYQGLTGLAGGVAFLNAAAAAAQGDPSIGDVSIYGLSGAPRRPETIADASDFANIHPYPQRGNQPYDVLLTRIGTNGVPGKGLVITETGYHTGVGNGSWEGVDEATQAKLTLNLLADATKLGVAKTFLYQLNDVRDPTGVNVDSNLGLFDTSFQPKPVASAIHNLTSALADTGPLADTFDTRTLDFTLSGLPERANSLLLQKSSGVHALMLWAEPDIWDEANDRPITVAPTDTRVVFAGPVDVRVIDPLLGDQPIAVYQEVSEVTLPLSDHPVILEVMGAAGIAATAAAAAPPLWLNGGRKADRIEGQAGDDLLKGLGGDDVLLGGAGADWLLGGQGADRLTGGSGADVFAFKTAGDSRAKAFDRILDFDAAAGDRIDLSGVDASVRAAGNQAFSLGGGRFTKAAGELIQTVQADGVLVQGDLNGDSRADFALLLAGVQAPLTLDAFML